MGKRPKKEDQSKVSSQNPPISAHASQQRVFNVEIPLSMDPGKDHLGFHDELAKAVHSKLSNAR